MSSLQKEFEKYKGPYSEDAALFRSREAIISGNIPKLLDKAASDAVIACVINHHRRRKDDPTYTPTLLEFMYGMVKQAPLQKVLSENKGVPIKVSYAIDGLRVGPKGKSVKIPYIEPVQYTLSLVKMAKSDGIETVLNISNAVAVGLRNYAIHKGRLKLPRASWLRIGTEREEMPVEAPKVESPLRELATGTPIDLFREALRVIAPAVLDYKGPGELVLFSKDEILILDKNYHISAVLEYNKEGRRWINKDLIMDKIPPRADLMYAEMQSFSDDLTSELVKAFQEISDDEIAESEKFARKMQEDYQITIFTLTPGVGSNYTRAEFEMQDLKNLDRFLLNASLLHGIIDVISPALQAERKESTNDDVYRLLCRKKLNYTVNAALGHARDPSQTFIILNAFFGGEHQPRISLTRPILLGLRSHFELASEVLFLNFADTLFTSMGMEKYDKFKDLWWTEIQRPMEYWKKRTAEASNDAFHPIVQSVFLANVIALQRAANGGPKLILRRLQREFFEKLFKRDLGYCIESPNKNVAAEASLEAGEK